MAPLNWGLGHATRSMPVIDQLLAWGARVILAGDGRSMHLLRREYPHLEHVSLPSYHVRYTSGSSMPLVTLLRTPIYLNAIYREHQALDRLIGTHRVDLVISDNRYGMWSRKVPCVFMCHQIAIIPPRPAAWTTPGFYWLQRAFYAGFRQVWVPDFAGSPNLTGRLSHGYVTDDRLRYIGPVSRFMNMKPLPASGFQADYVVVLSGPEPQRSLLEAVIVEQAASIPADFLIVQGKTESFSESRQGNLRFVSYLTARELYTALTTARAVIARAGYSTVMDLCFMSKRAVLIPTPGQTEQEYLAARLERDGMAVVQRQDWLNLGEALERAETLSGFTDLSDRISLQDHLARALGELLPDVTTGSGAPTEPQSRRTAG